jgi:DNA repair protein RecN (Recombination protein N)
MSPQLEELLEKLTALRYAADDAAETLKDLSRDFDFSPDELDRVESRLDVIYRLKKKYGPTVEDMLDYLERCRKELSEIQDADDTIALLTAQEEKARQEAVKRGQVLTQARKKAAAALESRVQEELRQLDMPKVRFQTEFLPCPTEGGMDGNGMEQVQFLMSANVGEAMKPIQKVASGGELARIMLALKNVLAEDDGVGSMVFDEVDTGVSGRAAQKVAEKMADVARHKQVLCVTHLPQIAAMADAHFSVEKGERNGRTYTRVDRLDETGRTEELARLVGGAQVTDAIRQSAAELLRQAERYRAEKR